MDRDVLKLGLFIFFCLASVFGSAPVPDEDGELEVEAQSSFVDINPLYNNGVLPKDLEDGRLPTTLRPSHYTLEIQPDIYTGEPPFVSNGSVTITFRAVEETNQIVLNYHELTFIEDSLQLLSLNFSAPAPNIVDWGVIPESNFFIVTLDDDMNADHVYTFHVSFVGRVVSAAGRYGLYWDSYIKDGEIRYIMGSQLQTAGARRVFPCFDEPAFKSAFDVSIVRRLSMTAIGNGELISSEVRPNGWIADYFASTPVMSSYLLAFCLVDFSYLETITSTGTISRLWVRDDALEAADFPNEIIGPLTEWLEEFTGIENILPIVNHVALPSHGGAMENWGLIIYGESSLLWNEDWYGASSMRGTGTIIAHELTHFWFGNLVTCDWWSDTWLNEGFASYFESMATEAIGWNGDHLTYHRRLRSMLNNDIHRTVQPVRPDIGTALGGALAFTSSSYSKGASMLRMIETILTPTVFQDAIQNYLREHAFSTAVSDDLWDELTEAAAEANITNPDGSAMDFKEKFDPWILQRGYPLIRAIRNYKTGTITLSQSHFNPNNEDFPTSDFDYRWNVPITIISEDDDNFSPGSTETLDAWMDRVQAITIEDQMPENETSWYLVNPGTKFFYRVQYDQRNMDNIKRQLWEDHRAFTQETRAAIIEDTFTLAREGILTEVDAFEVSSYLDDERTGVPWLVFDSYLGYTARLLHRFPETDALLTSYIKNLTEEVYERKGWEMDWDETIYQIKLREMSTRLACTFGNEDCLANATDLFKQWSESDPDDNPIVVALRPLVYCMGVREGTRQDWNQVYQRYMADRPSHLPYYSVEKSTLLQSLACSEDETTLKLFLQMMFSPVTIPISDASSAMIALAESHMGREIVWDHLKENWRNNSVPVGVARGPVLHAVVNGFASEKDQLKLAEFIAMYPPEGPAEEAMYDTATEIITENRYWAERNVDALHEWLSNNQMRSA